MPCFFCPVKKAARRACLRTCCYPVAPPDVVDGSCCWILGRSVGVVFVVSWPLYHHSHSLNHSLRCSMCFDLLGYHSHSFLYTHSRFTFRFAETHLTTTFPLVARRPSRALSLGACIACFFSWSLFACSLLVISVTVFRS